MLSVKQVVGFPLSCHPQSTKAGGGGEGFCSSSSQAFVRAATGVRLRLWEVNPKPLAKVLCVTVDALDACQCVILLCSCA